MDPLFEELRQDGIKGLTFFLLRFVRFMFCCVIYQIRYSTCPWIYRAKVPGRVQTVHRVR